MPTKTPATTIRLSCSHFSNWPTQPLVWMEPCCSSSYRHTGTGLACLPPQASPPPTLPSFLQLVKFIPSLGRWPVAPAPWSLPQVSASPALVSSQHGRLPADGPFPSPQPLSPHLPGPQPKLAHDCPYLCIRELALFLPPQEQGLCLISIESLRSKTMPATQQVHKEVKLATPPVPEPTGSPQHDPWVTRFPVPPSPTDFLRFSASPTAPSPAPSHLTSLSRTS